MSVHNGKQNGYIGAYVNVEEAYEDIERLLKENKNIEILVLPEQCKEFGFEFSNDVEVIYE